MSVRSTSYSNNRTRRVETELTDLFDNYYDNIARYAAVHIGNRDDAQDIAAEVFLRAFKSMDDFDERGIPIHCWLFKIAHNLVVDHLRKKSRQRMVDVDSITIAAGEKTPEQLIEQKTEMERVKIAMTGLTPDQQQVISLRFLGELSSKETARVLGKTDGAVREMQRAALVRLRTILAGGR